MPESTSPWGSFILGLFLGATGLLFALASNAQIYHPIAPNFPISPGHDSIGDGLDSTCSKNTVTERIEKGTQMDNDMTASDKTSAAPTTIFPIPTEDGEPDLELVNLTLASSETTVNIDDLHELEGYIYDPATHTLCAPIDSGLFRQNSAVTE